MAARFAFAKPGPRHHDHRVKPAHAALGHEHADNGGDDALEVARQRGPDRDRAEERVLGAEPGQHRLVDRVLSVREAADVDRDARPVADVETGKLRDRALLDRLIRVQDALQRDLGVRRHLQIDREAAGERDRLAQEPARDV